MLYRTFIDDSADERQEIVVVAGALVARDRHWGELSRKWTQRLKHDGLRYFRSTEYNSLRGEFSVFTNSAKYPKPKGSEAARKLRDDLEAIIKRFPIVGVACVIPIPEYRQTVTEYELETKLDPDPFSAAMQSVMRACALMAKDQLAGENNLVGFVCDDSPNSAKLSAAYAGFKYKNLRIQDSLAGFAHLDDKKCPPLQAADMVASMGKQMAFEYFKKGQDITLPRLQGVFHKLEIWDRDLMRRLAAVQ